MSEKKKTKDADCSCKRKSSGRAKQKVCKRKRQTLVYNPDEEIWHEPYMQCLRKEFSEISIPCDSKIELPWKDIALPAAGMKIRANVVMTENEENADGATDEEGEKVDKKVSTGTMHLPWDDLLVTDTVQAVMTLDNGAPCDSTLEIPWSDLALEKPIDIRPIPEEEPCAPEEIEIPWDEILVPGNIVIETKKKKKHPSSKAPKRETSSTSRSTTLCGHKACCLKAGKKQ